MATQGNGLIYASSDGGATWSPTIAPSNNWAAVASSADGARLVAAASTYLGDSSIYTSGDAGVTWTRTAAPTNDWSSVACSADGTKLVASTYLGPLTRSTNSGVSWAHTSAPGLGWQSLASSADGTKLLAAAAPEPSSGLEGPIYMSTDSGATWHVTSAPSAIWLSVASSADGSLAAAVGAGVTGILSNAQLPTSFPPSPRLSIDIAAADVRLSWLIPSASFVLQQSSSLDSSGWVDVTTQPTLSFANLHNEVMLHLSSVNAFYRLKQK